MNFCDYFHVFWFDCGTVFKQHFSDDSENEMEETKEHRSRNGNKWRHHALGKYHPLSSLPLKKYVHPTMHSDADSVIECPGCD